MHITLAFLGIGGGEFIFIFLAVLMLFGSDKLPEIARGLGKAMKQVRHATDDIKREINSSAGLGAQPLQSLKNPLQNPIQELQQEIEDSIDGAVKRGGSAPKSE
jgi:sec-independent protein translocase protein TatA